MAIDKIKRKKGDRYRVRVQKNGQWITKTFNRYYDAKEFQKDLQHSSDGDYRHNFSFADAAAEWVSNHVEVYKSASSISSDKQMLRDVLLPTFCKKPLVDIRPEDIDILIQRLIKKGLSAATVNRHLEVIRTIFNYSIKRRKAFYNPMSAVKMLKVPQPKLEFWTEYEAQRFLEYAEERYKEQGRPIVALFYKFALNTGMRLGEIIALRWHDVDLDNMLITVCRTRCYKSRTIKETTKGGKIRHVPINRAIYDNLVELKKRSQHELVFTVLGTPLDHANVTKWFRRDIKAAGVKKIRFHDLRHTYASHFVMNGGSVYTLQAILGHSDIKTTERYAHLSKAFLVDKADTVHFSSKGNVVKVDFGKVSNA